MGCSDEEGAHALLVVDAPDRLGQQRRDRHNLQLLAVLRLGAEGDRVCDHELLEGRVRDAPHRRSGEHGVGDGRGDGGGAGVRKGPGRLREGARGVHDVVDDHAGLTLDVADDVHDLGDVGLLASLVDDGEPGVEPLGVGAGALHAAGVGRDDGERLGRVARLDRFEDVIRAYVYDAYGGITQETGTLANPFTYTGREFDVENGLYFYRARYYDAMSGRFLSTDPLGFSAGDSNLYRYVFNNPINLTDPLGLQVGCFNLDDCLAQAW